MEVCSQGCWDATMLADYGWFIKRDDAPLSRKSVKRQFEADGVYV